jgi:prolycopene isomerase
MARLENGIQGDTIPIYAPVPTNYDPGLAPEGCQIITAAAVAPTLDVPLADNEQVWINGLMDAMHRMVPDLKENTLFADTWTVADLAEWLGKSNGSVITTGQTIDQVGSCRPAHRTPVDGLYIAGDCAGPARGVGTELACRSGMDCGDLVAADLERYRQT